MTDTLINLSHGCLIAGWCSRISRLDICAAQWKPLLSMLVERFCIEVQGTQSVTMTRLLHNGIFTAATSAPSILASNFQYVGYSIRADNQINRRRRNIDSSFHTAIVAELDYTKITN